MVASFTHATGGVLGRRFVRFRQRSSTALTVSLFVSVLDLRAMRVLFTPLLRASTQVPVSEPGRAAMRQRLACLELLVVMPWLVVLSLVVGAVLLASNERACLLLGDAETLDMLGWGGYGCDASSVCQQVGCVLTGQGWQGLGFGLATGLASCVVAAWLAIGDVCVARS
jgi:hypothetical protein